MIDIKAPLKTSYTKKELESYNKNLRKITEIEKKNDSPYKEPYKGKVMDIYI